MRKIFLFVWLLASLSCNDGDLDISSFEFEDKVNICGTVNYTLYRLSTNDQREALIVTLSNEQIRKDEDVVQPVSVTENGPYTVTYRLFEDSVNDNYFCAAVPPIEPKVVKDWRGVAGTILVQNEPVYDEDGVTITGWKSNILLVDVVLKVDDQELRLDEVYVFGTAETGPAS